MDRQPWYVAQGITSYDLNNIPKDAVKGLGWLTAFILGAQGTYVDQFGCSQTVTPSLTVNLTEGHIYQPSAVDDSPIGTFAADAMVIMQQGYVGPQSLALNSAGIASGQEQWWLIQCQFKQQDAVRVGDATAGARNFYNSADPPNPLNGQDGLGGTVPTVRLGLAKVTAIGGIAAATGTAVPPQPSAGNVPLYLIKLAYNQTTITDAQIQRAGPLAYAGYPVAPYISGLLNQHHLGIPGHAPKIVLGGAGKEVQGTMDLLNLPATNQNVTALLTTYREQAGDPNGTLAGCKGDWVRDTSSDILWNCKVTGIAGVAVWTNNSPVGGELISTFPATITKSRGVFMLALSTADGPVALPSPAQPRELEFKSAHSTQYKAILNSGAYSIWKDDSLITSLEMLAGQAFRLVSCPNLATPANSLWYVM